MKAEFCETVEVTGHVEITVEMIQSALAEGLSDVDLQYESDFPNETEAQKLYRRRHAVGSVARDVYRCLSAITDNMIAEQSAGIRRSLGTFLAEQSRRWMGEPTDE